MSKAMLRAERKLRLRCRLQVHTMPMGNQMLVFNPTIAASPDGAHMVAENVVDAHTIPGISMESIIQQAPAAMQVRAAEALSAGGHRMMTM